MIFRKIWEVSGCFSLTGALKVPHEMPGELLVVDCDESVGSPLQAGPPSPAHSVGVSVDISE